MKTIFGQSADIDGWMRLVRMVSWNSSDIETEE